MAPTISQSNEILTINLSRALSRLERKILSSPSNSSLRHSSYERAKTSAVSITSHRLLQLFMILEPRALAAPDIFLLPCI